jgi:hypothetical protein
MSSRSVRIRGWVAIVALTVAACSGSASTSTTRGTPAGDQRGSLGDFRVRCYAEYGIVAEKLSEKFPDQGFPDDDAVFIADNYQQALVQEVSEKCDKAAIATGLIRDERDPAVLREIYRERVELYECLVENGYPASVPPSEEVLLEEDGAWDTAAAFPPDVELIKEAAEV